VYWPVEELRQQFESNCTARGDDPSEAIAGLIGPERDVDSFWDQVKTNLRAGKIRMLFVADQIPNELKRIVEFLNGQMKSAEVLALELRQFEGQGLKTLVPMVYGQTQEAQHNKATGAPKRSWDFASICGELERKSGPEAVRVAEKIYIWMQSHADQIEFGKGATQGSIRAKFGHATGSFCPLEPGTDGKLWVNFNYMKRPFDNDDRRLELLRRINQINGSSIQDSSISGHPTIPLSVLADETQFTKFRSAMDWFVEELRTA
jgi:hypothetical protein